MKSRMSKLIHWKVDIIWQLTTHNQVPTCSSRRSTSWFPHLFVGQKWRVVASRCNTLGTSQGGHVKDNVGMEILLGIRHLGTKEKGKLHHTSGSLVTEKWTDPRHTTMTLQSWNAIKNIHDKITRVWLAENGNISPVTRVQSCNECKLKIARALPKFRPSWLSVMRFWCKLFRSNIMISHARSSIVSEWRLVTELWSTTKMKMFCM